MEIYITKLHITDADNLLNFEIENRSFFEEMVPPRGDEYYNHGNFRSVLENLLEEQAIGRSHFYLIKDKDASILGRINLVDIDEAKKIGTLGYRVGKVHTGKGIANKALNLLITSITDANVKQIHAQTTTNNIASQKVLEKNGFERINTSTEEFDMNGQKVSFVYYTLNISS